MHPYLTDVLACTRCGPEFGLVLRADLSVDGRVRSGSLGCPNCRDTFPIADGFADLRAPPRGEMEPGLVPGEGGSVGDGDEASRDGGSDRSPVNPGAGERPGGAGRPLSPSQLSALLAAEGSVGRIALVGGPAAAAGELARQLPDLEVIGIDGGLARRPAGGWSRMAARPGLPFRSNALAGCAVDGRLGTAAVEEAARATAPGRRIVVTEVDEATCRWIGSGPLRVLLSGSVTVLLT